MYIVQNFESNGDRLVSRSWNRSLETQHSSTKLLVTRAYESQDPALLVVIGSFIALLAIAVIICFTVRKFKKAWRARKRREKEEIAEKEVERRQAIEAIVQPAVLEQGKGDTKVVEVVCQAATDLELAIDFPKRISMTGDVEKSCQDFSVT
ncbi:hypothetical protein EW146_g3942 [Bondarzewia mesenterica]|uniref:Uncharacterized protein n=1 Tax=Bondarzewia mesenterica TaxID=1095465 RepID=A0A4S4LXV4_9AGAM|nr:hypothetical protein EW146_g3942 [Bondarzewia mesenterica]